MMFVQPPAEALTDDLCLLTFATGVLFDVAGKKTAIGCRL